MEKEYNRNEAIKESKQQLIEIKKLLNNSVVDLFHEFNISKENEKKFNKKSILSLVGGSILMLPGIYFLMGLFIGDISSTMDYVLWTLSGLSAIAGGAIAYTADIHQDKSFSCRSNSFELEEKIDQVIKSEELINEAYEKLDEQEEIKVESNPSVKVIGYEDSYSDVIIPGFSLLQYYKEEALERKLIKE